MRLFVGSIVSGTLRPDDLLSAFAHELALHSHGEHKALIHESLCTVIHIRATGDTYPYQVEGMLEELNTALNKLTPAGYYFGPHPDNADDFGVWQLSDWNEMMSGYEQWLEEDLN